jgi:hypothetical protein
LTEVGATSLAVAEPEASAVSDEMETPTSTPPVPGTDEPVEAATDLEVEAGWADMPALEVEEDTLAVDTLPEEVVDEAELVDEAKAEDAVEREVATPVCGMAAGGADWGVSPFTVPILGMWDADHFEVDLDDSHDTGGRDRGHRHRCRWARVELRRLLVSSNSWVVPGESWDWAPISDILLISKFRWDI